MNIMNFVYILFSIVILGLIVLVHELGHYIAGRLCGIGIVEFSVGFGPKIIGWTRKDIQYSLRVIPLGGYCKFVGEDEDNPRPDAMNRQPVWKRFVTVLSGPVMNFVLAYVVVIIFLMMYVGTNLPVVGGVVADMPAVEAGLQAGDIITQVDGIAISFDNDGAEQIRAILQSGDMIATHDFAIERDGKETVISIAPVPVETETVDENGQTVTQTAYQIGISFDIQRYSFFEAAGGATRYMYDTTVQMLTTLKNLVFKGEGVKEVSGPIGIVSVMSGYVTGGAYIMLRIVFLISLNLGIMNLLPLPALDGGRLVFLIIEGIRRKPVPPEKEGLVHAIGLMLLFGLIAVVSVKDVWEIIARMMGKA
jgi:regulator of sigma E protease